MPDIDIDFSDRQNILAKIQYIPAAIRNEQSQRKHATGIYCQTIPVDPILGCASIDYLEAEQRGYFKLDFLNVNFYQNITNEQQLLDLMNKEPSWHKLYDKEFTEQLIHINSHYNTLIAMPEAITSIEHMAMFLAIIRPAKRHLIGRKWDDVAKTVWKQPTDGEYHFKHSHSIAYSHLVVVNMNYLSKNSSD